MTMDKFDIYPLASVPLHLSSGQVCRLIGGVVENLDLKPLAGIGEMSHGVYQPAYYIDLVEDGQLHRHRGPLVKMRKRLGLVTVAKIQVDEDEGVEAVKSQKDRAKEIEDADEDHRVTSLRPFLVGGEYNTVPPSQQPLTDSRKSSIISMYMDNLGIEV